MIRTRSKKRNNYLHTKKRIRQRYGISLSRGQYNSLCNQIRNGRSIHLGRQTPSRAVHQVKLGQLKLIVVYNSHSNNICTILHPGRKYKLV